MREWNLKSGNPISLTLAADTRLRPTEYTGDQTWEINLESGEPPALALQTTYGLRARSLRLFPRFLEGDNVATAPANFASPSVIKRFFPNYLVLDFSPFPGLDVTAEYWVPESRACAGRLLVTNSSSRARQVRFEWVAQLTPQEGERMATREIEAALVLVGKTEDLAPVVFLAGGPQPGTGSYPSLALLLELAPGQKKLLTWTQAALSTLEDSFNLARNLANRKWEAELARIEMLNSSLVDIYTGDLDWDAAFALAQKQALSLFMGPTQRLPAASFVLSRHPDLGYSRRGDGSDFNHLWNGQPPLEALYLASIIQPSAPELVKGILRNYISTQAADGFIDWKPGLAGQRSRLMATPVLAHLAWKTFEASRDITFLKEMFPALLKYFHLWLTSQFDRDADGIPEWSHAVQGSLEDHPLYSRWQENSFGIEISTAESPTLCAYLYNECQALLNIARLLNEPDLDGGFQGDRSVLGDLPNSPLLNEAELHSSLQKILERLKAAVEAAWDEEDQCLYDYDRDTHAIQDIELLTSQQGGGEIVIQQRFQPPARLLVRIYTSGETTRRTQILVHCTDPENNPQVDQIPGERLKWYLGVGSMTSERVYTHLDKLEILGLAPEDTVRVYRAGFRFPYLPLYLPLWAGMLEQAQAKVLIEEHLLDPHQYWHTYGLSGSTPEKAGLHAHCLNVSLPWNALIGTGLLNYGYRQQAAELVSHLMAGVIQSLKLKQAFYRYFHADSGQTSGEQHALQGLAPLGLFLETLGVSLVSSTQVNLVGFNPFPWPVTVKYRGMTVLRQRDKSMVIFPDGQTVVVSDPAPCTVSLEIEKNEFISPL